ncbi:ATP-grasp domain-containing protein [Halomicroarcula limicola]|uniref:ATP-grasp domain-containing protein n=1 Tax=Haloarcula limicola TaxID=1429915 RepID=A0A8J8C7B0_9EURY|nr:ATP-grasp domain-containing protein [Halomicroarcula limicola]MBV0923380.1 ATP-grasp domain-containing protein [Halomicroarcula limicola]
MDNPAVPDGSAVVISNDAPGSVTTVRSLGKRGVRTIVASDSDRSPAFASKYCDERVRLPSPYDDLLSYRDVLLDLAARPSVKTIVPVREEDVYVLSRYREAFEDYLTPVWPTMETLAAVHDRLALFSAAERAGVAVPETRLLTDVDDWDRRLIAKGRYGALTDYYVDEIPPTESWSMPNTQYFEPGDPPDVEDLIDRMGHVPIVQEYVAGTEYTIRALYDEGEALFSTQKALRRGFKYPRGPSVYHEAVDIPELREAGLAVLDELGWHGVASVGFIRDDETGEFKILEVNPRFWSSLPCDLHAGVDYPLYYWRLANGDRGPFAPDYRPGTASHFLRGEISHLHSVATEEYPFVEKPSLSRTAAATVGSMVAQPHFDFLDRDDVRPFVRDTVNAVLEKGGIGTSRPTTTVSAESRPVDTESSTDGPEREVSADRRA